MTTVRDIYNFLDRLAPFASQMEWDNSGLVLGGPAQEVRRAAVCLDIPCGVPPDIDLIISHHPVIFQARKSFTNLLDPAMALLRQGIAAIAFHTNYDSCPGGVNDILAARLGLQDVEILQNGVRVGSVAPTSIQNYAKFVGSTLHCGVVKYRAADDEASIRRIAVCGGAGCSFLPDLYEKADVYITGDAGHHDFLDAAQNGIALMAAGHYHTETIAVPPLFDRLCAAFPAVEWKLTDCGGETTIISQKEQNQ